MKKFVLAPVGLLLFGLVQAENLEGVDKMICAAAQAQICIEHDTCYFAAPADLDIPDFVVIDIDEKNISTTKASEQDRSTAFSSVLKSDGLIHLQGLEGGRAFGIVINQATGHMTAAVLRDGLSVSVFGVCTDADI